MELVTCHYCKGEGWKDEGDPEIGSAPMDCHVCDGTGKEPRFTRWPNGDRRIKRGDDFACDCWIDRKTNQKVYGAVGHDRNA